MLSPLRFPAQLPSFQRAPKHPPPPVLSIFRISYPIELIYSLELNCHFGSCTLLHDLFVVPELTQVKAPPWPVLAGVAQKPLFFSPP